MAETGLDDIMSYAFRGVGHVFTVTNFTHTFRATCIVIQNTVQEANDDDDDLISRL